MADATKDERKHKLNDALRQNLLRRKESTRNSEDKSQGAGKPGENKNDR